MNGGSAWARAADKSPQNERFGTPSVGRVPPRVFALVDPWWTLSNRCPAGPVLTLFGMATRSDAELQDQSIHVLWEFRQLMRLATHLYDRRHVGIVTMVEPLDAAALESFCLHARALVEFLWRDRAHDSRLGKNDAVAGDWFDTGSWRYEPTLPPEVREVRRRTGFALAHISYKRINPNEVWGWDHVGIAHRIASRFYTFASDAPAERVDPRFYDEATRENLKFREHMVEKEPGLLPASPEPVGTPAHASLWIAPRP